MGKLYCKEKTKINTRRAVHPTVRRSRARSAANRSTWAG